MKQRGRFITLEGIEGVGKSTAMTLIDNQLKKANIAHVLTREPGGTIVAESIRQVLLSQYDEPVHPLTELLLLFASRAQHIVQCIQPHLDKGYWVICDRFIDATYAYQGGGRGINQAYIQNLEQCMPSSIQPDLTLLLNAPLSVCLSRLSIRNQGKDRIEQESMAFFKRVKTAYMKRASQCSDRFRIIDAGQSIADVEQQIVKVLSPLFHTSS